MAAGLTIAFVMLAQTASGAVTASPAPATAYGPAAPAAAKPQPKPAPAPVKTAAEACNTPRPGSNGREIVVCAPHSDGYRLNPDVMEAKREKHGAGRPVRPGPIGITDNSCAHVGPVGCRGTPAINLIAVAMTAAEMSKRLAEGKEIGSMFKTTPDPTEYDLYKEAKARREAKEAEAAAKSKAAAAQAAAAKAAADKAAAATDSQPAQ